MEIRQATRIQTSVFNATEKKILVYLAERQPKWVSSDLLTFIGFLGALIIAAGYILSGISIHFLWLSSLGLVINWYGDSLDGTLARVRNTQRPLYGYYLDHTMDGINETIMFVGAGLSPLMHLPLAMAILVLYLLLTISVSINAHLKKEFRLTFIKMGPTEFRMIAIAINTLFATIAPLREFATEITIFGSCIELRALDLIAIGMIVVLALIHVSTVFMDARDYARIDPKK